MWNLGGGGLGDGVEVGVDSVDKTLLLSEVTSSKSWCFRNLCAIWAFFVLFGACKRLLGIMRSKHKEKIKKLCELARNSRANNTMDGVHSNNIPPPIPPPPSHNRT